MKNKYKYFIQNQLLHFILLVLERFTKFFFKKKNVSSTIKIDNASSILISNSGHLGDAVYVAILISQLRKINPKIKIGILSGVWNEKFYRLFNPHQIHNLDFFMNNRNNFSIFLKIFIFLMQRRKIVKEIKSFKYDVFIDTNLYFPNSFILAAQFKITNSISFSSARFSNFYTHTIDNSFIVNTPIQLVYEKILRFFPCNNLDLKAQNFIPFSTSFEFKKPTFHKIFSRSKYICIHTGSGSEIRKLTYSFWIDLITALHSLEYKVILVGQGSYDYAYNINLSSFIRSGLLLDFTNKLNFNELAYTIKNSLFLIGLESFACHFASAIGKSNIMIKTGTSLNMWVPAFNSTILTKKIDCNPCLKRKGCNSMACINEIRYSDILNYLPHKKNNKLSTIKRV
jgi:ADP-heptose:LPS heptosyltransferase